MPEQLGKRNCSKVSKPERVKVRKHPHPVTPPGKARFYIVVVAALLLLVVAGYALAV